MDKGQRKRGGDRSGEGEASMNTRWQNLKEEERKVKRRERKMDNVCVLFVCWIC